MSTASNHAPGFDQAALTGLMNHVKGKPEAGKTVWKAQTQWQGGFRSQAQIRNFTVSMDEPTPLGGSDTAPNMVELVLLYQFEHDLPLGKRVKPLLRAA